MAIILRCKNGHTMRVKDDAYGKKVRCPECQTLFVVDEDSEVDPSELKSASTHKAQRHATKKGKGKGKHRGKSKSGSTAWVLWLAIGGTVVTLGVVGMILFFAFQTVSENTDPSLVAAESHETNEPGASPEASSPETPPTQPTETTPAVAQAETSPAVTSSETATPAPSPAGNPVTPAVTTTQPAVTNSTTLAANVEIPKNGLRVWDTGSSGAIPQLTERSSAWEPVAYDANAPHEFQGSCVIENEKLWLHIPRDFSSEIRIAAKDNTGPEVVVPVTFLGGTAEPSGNRTIQLTEVSDKSVSVSVGGKNVAEVTCRIPLGKYWVEFQPKARAEQLEIGVHAQYVVVPTEFGEDFICDPAENPTRKTIPLPRENLVIALEKNGNTQCLLTYPTTAQAGEVKVSSATSAVPAGGKSAGEITSLSAKFAEHSVFVSLLPQKDQWFSEGVGKKYSAAGQYEISWKPPYAGVWRLVGRIPPQQDQKKKQKHRPNSYFITDVLPERFIFACSRSGTLECLFGYLSRANDAAAGDLVTPMSIYQETIGESAASDTGNAYLQHTEIGGAIYVGKTKYRDVCNSIDDIKETWKAKPNEIINNPNYVPNMLQDCQKIIHRLNERIKAYEELTNHLEEVVEKLDSAEFDKENEAYKTFRSAARRNLDELIKVRPVSIERVAKLAEEIEQKLQKPTNGRFHWKTLDELAEKIRDVANHQEDRLKEYREAALHLSEACSKQRDVTDAPLNQYIADLGHHCRKVLRFRDTEE